MGLLDRGRTPGAGAGKTPLLNDFTALALALPALDSRELRKVGGGEAVPGRAIGLIGAGTGLGISGLVPCGRDYAPIEGEGGHVTLAASDAREAALIAHVARRFPHVSAERILSGSGLVTLYEATAELAGVPPEALGPSDITTRASSGSCDLCVDTVNTFCAMLGTVAADLAVILGAKGGLYIGGGIVPRLGEFFRPLAVSYPLRAEGALQRLPCPHPDLRDRGAIPGAARRGSQAGTRGGVTGMPRLHLPRGTGPHR